MFNLKDKILKYGSFGLVLLLPIMYFYNNLYPHVSSKTFFIYGLIQVLFFVWIYSLVSDSSYRLKKQDLYYMLPGGLFVSWMSLSSFFALNTNLAIYSSLARGTGLLTLVHSFIFSIIFLSLLRKNGKDYLYKFLNFFILGGFLGVLSIWFGPSGFNIKIDALMNGGEGGLMGNSSLAAAYSFFTVIFSLFLIYSKNITKINRNFLIGGIFIVLCSPLFINVMGFFNNASILGAARAGVLGIIVSIATYIIFYFIFSNKKNINKIGVSLLFLSIIAFGLIWNNFMTPGTVLHQKFTESATGTRFIFWDIASKAMHDRPVLGYGLENYSIVFQKYFNPNILQKQNSMEGWTDKAHNMYFDMGVSGGYTAIVLYSLFVLFIIYLIYRAFLSGGLNRVQASLLISLIIGYIFQNLFAFESNMSILATFILSSIVIYAASIDLAPLSKTNQDDDEGNNIILIFILSIVCIYSLYISFYQPMKKAVMYKEVFSSSFGSTTPDYDSLSFGASIGSDWDAGDSAYRVYQNYSGNAMSLKNSKQAPQLVKNLDALIKYLYKVQEINKTDYRLYITTVYLENTMTFLTGRPLTPELKTKLYKNLDFAKSINSHDPNLYFTYVQLKVWEGDFEGAKEYYREAIRVAPELPASYNLPLRFAQMLNDKKFFDEVYTQAIKNIPDFKIN